MLMALICSGSHQKKNGFLETANRTNVYIYVFKIYTYIHVYVYGYPKEMGFKKITIFYVFLNER